MAQFQNNSRNVPWVMFSGERFQRPWYALLCNKYFSENRLRRIHRRSFLEITWNFIMFLTIKKKVREKSRECHNHKLQPFPDPKRKRKPTNLNKHKPNKHTKSTKISPLFPKLGNCNTKRNQKHKNKMTHGKTNNISPSRINHKATKSKTNTGTTALERPVEQTTEGWGERGGGGGG